MSSKQNKSCCYRQGGLPHSGENHIPLYATYPLQPIWSNDVHQLNHSTFHLHAFMYVWAITSGAKFPGRVREFQQHQDQQWRRTDTQEFLVRLRTTFLFTQPILDSPIWSNDVHHSIIQPFTSTPSCMFKQLLRAQRFQEEWESFNNQDFNGNLASHVGRRTVIVNDPS